MTLVLFDAERRRRNRIGKEADIAVRKKSRLDYLKGFLLLVGRNVSSLEFIADKSAVLNYSAGQSGVLHIRELDKAVPVLNAAALSTLHPAPAPTVRKLL